MDFTDFSFQISDLRVHTFLYKFARNFCSVQWCAQNILSKTELSLSTHRHFRIFLKYSQINLINPHNSVILLLSFFPFLFTFCCSLLLLLILGKTLGWTGKNFKLDNLDLSHILATYQVNNLEYQLTFHVIVSTSSSAKQG